MNWESTTTPIWAWILAVSALLMAGAIIACTIAQIYLDLAFPKEMTKKEALELQHPSHLFK